MFTGLLTLPGLLIALLAGLPCVAAEYVYVESNLKAPNANSIYAFRRDPQGNLHQLPGSPFLTGGAGVQDSSLKLGPYDSDQNIVTNADQSLLLAVNSGSDTIAVFRINADGTLKAVPGSPFPSGGTNPVSLGVVGEYLVVVNKNGDFARVSNQLPNYTVFRIGSDGGLSPIENSTIQVALGSSPTQALIIPGTNLVFGADFLGGLLQHLQLRDDGVLSQRPPMGLPASEFTPDTPRLPLGLWFHPHLPLLYVGFVTENRLGVYWYNQRGRLQFIRTVPNSGQAICWLRTNKSGTRLYSSDTGTNSISVYDLSLPDEPREVQNLVLSGPGNALQFSLSADEKYLYAISSRGSASIPEGQGNRLHILKVAYDGSVQELDSAAFDFNLPAGTRPQGVLALHIQ
jgi:hypothetical protein